VGLSKVAGKKVQKKPWVAGRSAVEERTVSRSLLGNLGVWVRISLKKFSTRLKDGEELRRVYGTIPQTEKERRTKNRLSPRVRFGEQGRKRGRHTAKGGRAIVPRSAGRRKQNNTPERNLQNTMKRRGYFWGNGTPLVGS